MAFFRYTATDANGKEVSGSVQARNMTAARQQLNSRGFRNVQFVMSSAPDTQTSSVFQTKPARDDELSHFYRQVASMIKAGINVNDAFTTLSNRIDSPDLQTACQEIASAARDGKGPSYVMAKFVDLFPHNDVGMVRAGEYGGFLSDALDYLARFYSESSAFKARWFVVRRQLWRGFIGAALVVAIMGSFWAGVMDGLSGFGRQFLTNLLWPVIPCVAIVLGAVYLFRSWLMSHQNLRLRHRLLLRAPFGIGERAKQESLTAFLWTLQGLQAAAVAPSTAWALASASVPNAEMAVLLSEAGRTAGEAPLSEAVRRSGVFPADYSSILRTGEQTGDVTEALAAMTKVSSDAYSRESDQAFSGIRTVSCLITALFFLIMAVVYIVNYFYGALDLIQNL